MAYQYPYKVGNFKFRVTIGSIGTIGFRKVSGLAEQTEVMTYREGMDPESPGKHPGQSKSENLTLEHGLDVESGGASQLLAEWRKYIYDASNTSNPSHPGAFGGNSDFRRPVEIVLYSKDGVGAAQWKVYDAWPVALKFGDLDASGNDVLIETLELAFNGLIEYKAGPL